MSISLNQIDLILKNLPYAAEAYNYSGKLIAVNKFWKDLWNYKSDTMPQSNIFKNNLIIKSGISDKLKELFENGGTLRTSPVICEPGDLDFTKSGINSIYKFYLYTLHEGDPKSSILINLIEDVTEEIKKSISEKELKQESRNSLTIFEMLETERKRVAQELHDVIGQKILLAKLNIELFQKKFSDTSPELKESIKHLIEISKEVKNIIHSLHPVVIEKYSLIDSLDLLAHEFSDSSGIKTSLKYFGNPEHDNIKVDLNIYRIIQESLNNVAKHSNASLVDIECHFTEKMFICSILDNGKGFDQSQLTKNGTKRYNYGIINMKERANAFGGDLTIDSSIGKGTRIYFQIPTQKRQLWKK